MTDLWERARRAVEDRLARFAGHDAAAARELVAGIGDDPARWAVVTGELVRSGPHELGRPTLEAIAVLMCLALAETPLDHPDREEFIRYYGFAQTRIVTDHDDRDVLAETTAVLTELVDDSGSSHPVPFLALFGLAVMAELRMDLDPGPATAKALVQALKRVVREAHDANTGKPELMANLGQALLGAFRFDPADHALLDEAIDCTRKALRLAGDQHPERGRLLHAAGEALKASYEARGDEHALAEALRLTRAAVRAEGEQVSPWWRTELADLCGTEYDLHKSPEVLDEEIRELGHALTSIPDEGVATARVRAGLASALRKRYQVAGRPPDLALAIDLMYKAASQLSDHPSEKSTVLGNLSATLTLQYELTDDEDARNESIRVGREATALGAAGSAERLRGLNNLAVNELTRYWQTGDSRALTESVQTFEAALAATPDPGPDRAGRLNNLGSALVLSFEHTGERELLDRSIAVNREALTMLPARDELRPGVLNELGARLRLQYLRFDDVAAAEEAVDVLAEAVTLTGPAGPDRFHFRINYSAAMHCLYKARRRPEVLDKAIDIAERTLAAAPPGYAGRASLLVACADPLNTRYREFGDLPAGRRSRAYLLAASQAPAPPARQIGAAQEAARMSTADGDTADALFQAVTLLPKAASRRLARSDQERHLGNFAGMVRDAGAFAVRAGSPERAVVALEQGRGVLLAQALEYRDDFAALGDRHPDLAEKLISCRDAINAAPAAGDQEHDRHHELALRWDRLVAQVRALRGFERFLLPPRFSDLCAQADAGPIVLINVSDVRSDALVLTADGLRVRELPDVRAEGVRNRVEAFLAAVDSTEDPARSAHRRVNETLAWLWDAVAGPVLDLLEITGPPPAGAPWPRIWWCPTGPLAFLPLHAAGHHDTAGQAHPRTVIDRVVSSYTPTIRALEHARRALSGDPGRRGSALAVTVPRTHGSRDLPGALDELAVLRDRLPHPPEELTGQDACHDAVLARLPHHPWVHFACHAFSGLDDPSSGHLLVHDHDTSPLSVGHVSRLHLRDAEFAYLSACSTGRSGLRLADESIHLASAFQLAGYRQVVATLWPITDRHAVRLAGWIYGGIVDNGLGSAAAAVHRATRRLRERWPDHPELWAAHIHAGA